VSTQRKRDLAALASAVTLAVAVGMLLWPIVSRADTPAGKAGRGFAAVTTPFLEIPGNILETSEREGPLAGWTAGLAKGIGMSIVRPPIGVYELVTAPIPVPKNFEPILQPEYPWSYFGLGGDRSVSRADTPAIKAGRGLAAVTTPFLEIPGNIVETSKREGPLAGWTAGLARGIGMSVVRPAIGVYELVTAPVSAPNNFASILQPEYPWSYFGSGEAEVAAPPPDTSPRSKR
jgi:putative exosortase-associated protein (TIGR04073 family)